MGREYAQPHLCVPSHGLLAPGPSSWALSRLTAAKMCVCRCVPAQWVCPCVPVCAPGGCLCEFMPTQNPREVSLFAFSLPSIHHQHLLGSSFLVLLLKISPKKQPFNSTAQLPGICPPSSTSQFSLPHHCCLSA